MSVGMENISIIVMVKIRFIEIPICLRKDMRFDLNSKQMTGLCQFKCKPRGMEACLHFRGAALNASEAGISRATEC